MTLCQEWLIRPGTRYDTAVLQQMIYEALYWQPDAEREPFEFVIAHEEISRYVDGWGRPGDYAVVAEHSGDLRGIGAAWYRLFSQDAPGYGFVSDCVPEVAIAVAEPFRGMGVGRAMLQMLIELARQTEVPSLSLSVEVANTRALRLYEQLGFVPVGGDQHNHTMLLDLTTDDA